MCSETQWCTASYTFLLLRQCFCFLMNDWHVAWCFDTVWTFLSWQQNESRATAKHMGPWDCASYGNHSNTMRWPNVTASQLPVRPVLPCASISRLRARPAFVSPTDPASSILWLFSTSQESGWGDAYAFTAAQADWRSLLNHTGNEQEQKRRGGHNTASCLLIL